MEGSNAEVMLVWISSHRSLLIGLIVTYVMTAVLWRMADMSGRAWRRWRSQQYRAKRYSNLMFFLFPVCYLNNLIGYPYGRTKTPIAWFSDQADAGSKSARFRYARFATLTAPFRLLWLPVLALALLWFLLLRLRDRFAPDDLSPSRDK